MRLIIRAVDELLARERPEGTTVGTRRCSPLFPFRCEGTIVTVVNENASTQLAIVLDNAPASPARVLAIIMTLPTELDERFPISLRKLAVGEAHDRYKLEASKLIVIEGDIGGTEQVQIIAGCCFAAITL
jgi:hypothetical protein